MVPARLTFACVMLAAAFALGEMWRTGERLSFDALHLDVRLIAVASLLEIALLGCMVALWHRILSFFSAPAPRIAALVRIWRRSTIAKYLPGSVWSAAVTAEMAERAGGSIVALPASFITQAAFSLCAAAIVAGLSGRVPGGALLPIAAAVGGVMLAHPRIVNAALELMTRRRRAVPPRWLGTWSAGVGLFLLHVAVFTGFGIAFALVLSSLGVAVAARYWPALVGINALAFASGFLAVIAPGGLGVRESVLVVLLAPLVPAFPTRVALAGAARLWLFGTEAAAIGISVAITSRESAIAGRLPRTSVTDDG